MTPQTIGQQKLNILLTHDGATTWARASGIPRVTNIAASAANNLAGSFGPTAAAPPYPALTVGDLTAVHMASKTLGWAVGGNDVLLAQVRRLEAAAVPDCAAAAADCLCVCMCQLRRAGADPCSSLLPSSRRKPPPPPRSARSPPPSAPTPRTPSSPTTCPSASSS